MRRTSETPVKFAGSDEGRTFNFVVSNNEQPPRRLLGENEILPGEVLEKGSFEEAVVAFQAALQSSPEEEAFSEGAINQRGLNALRDNLEFGTALLRVNTILYPDSANTWDSLGYAYKLAGQREKAIEAYKAALERDSEFPSAKTALKELTRE